MVDGQAAQAAARAFSIADILVALMLISAGTFLACVRYAKVLNALGQPIPLRLAVRASILGIIAGLVFFQIVGQTLARSAVLARQGIEGPAVLVANVFERVTVMFWLAALAGVAFIYLFGGSALASLGGNLMLLKFAATLAATMLAAAFVARRLLTPILRGAGRALSASGAAVGIYALLVHQATLASYMVLACKLAPEANLLDIAAASAIVMFAASMPISFAGWGVRELSAVFAYQAIGMPPAEALVVSIAIGGLNLLAVALGGLASQFIETEKAVPQHASAAEMQRESGRKITRTASLVLPLLAAVLVFFSVRVPIAGGELNVNLADPIAVCGGLVFLFRYARAGYAARAWRAPDFPFFVGMVTACLSLALLIGFLRFSFSEWAFFSRYVGWFVLLSYIATGALIVGDAGEFGRRMLLDAMTVAGLAVCGIDIVLCVLQTYGVLSNPFPSVYPSGATQNVNAYAVQLCIVLSILVTMPGRTGFWRGTPGMWSAAAVALVLANVYLAHSRTGYVVAACLIAAACVLVPSRRRTMALGTALACLIVAGSTIAISIALPSAHSHPATEAGQQRGPFVVSPLSSVRVAHASSDGERTQTIKRGLEFWSMHPVFGAGLGAFAEEARRQSGKLLVIHNTSVWALAELGIVGFGAVLGLMWSISRGAWQGVRASAPFALTLGFTLIAAGLFQMPHDIFYQRIFWLVLGVTLFRGTFASIGTVPATSPLIWHPRAVAS